MARRAAAVFLLWTPLTPLVIAQSEPTAQNGTPAPSGSKADDRIYDEVRRRLANDGDVKGAGIDVTVVNGVVTLKGRASSDKAKTKATSLAKKVKGVVSVDNQLRLFGVD